jgi:ankyrin repeat protein
VGSLLAHGADVSARNDANETAFVVAERSGQGPDDLLEWRRLAEQKAIVDAMLAKVRDLRSLDRETQLLVAVRAGQLETVRTLLAKWCTGIDWQ